MEKGWVKAEIVLPKYDESHNSLFSSPNLIDNILVASTGLAAGYLTKKFFVGKSANVFRKIFGSVLQLGVTNFVARHPVAIKSLGKFFIQQVHRKKTGIQKKRDR